MLARLLFLLALLLPLPAAAQEGPSSLEGSWALEIAGTVIFRFDLDRDPKTREWLGTWQRPESFASDGDRFAQIVMPARILRSLAGTVEGDSVEVSFNDPRPGAVPDVFRFRLIDRDAAEMVYVGTGLDPYIMQRVGPDTKLGPFKEGVTYARRLTRPNGAKNDLGPLPAIEPEPEPEPEDLPALPPVTTNPENLRNPPGAPVGR
ncbi:hypothetical protein GRI89_05330 [Altererythrobacter salegens]|uniref:Uncharacterized protein n=1 Tax=Croceibacterium salegens TaxID=1737568 RepID=A0A6I4SU76_9SPHN|nr:hypothetical protein [Croceibacterium salegens]MXO58958.1 hypothetical protein [Croceibacterium salegens]